MWVSHVVEEVLPDKVPYRMLVFTTPADDLEPGEVVLIVKNIEAFESRYDIDGLYIATSFTRTTGFRRPMDSASHSRSSTRRLRPSC